VQAEFFDTCLLKSARNLSYKLHVVGVCDEDCADVKKQDQVGQNSYGIKLTKWILEALIPATWVMCNEKSDLLDHVKDDQARRQLTTSEYCEWAERDEAM